MAITGTPNRRAELTASARQQANPQTAPMQQNMQPTQQTAQPKGGSGGSFYGGMGGGMGSDNGSFYSNLGGGMNRPSQTRMAPPPIASAPQQVPQSSMVNGTVSPQPQMPQSSPQPLPGAATYATSKDIRPNGLPSYYDPSNPPPAFQESQAGQQMQSMSALSSPQQQLGDIDFSSPASFAQGVRDWIAAGRPVTSSLISQAARFFPGDAALIDAVTSAAAGGGFNYTQTPTQQMPDPVTPAPPPPQADPRFGPSRGPSDKGSGPAAPRSGTEQAPKQASSSQYGPVSLAGTIYDRPSFNYTPAPQYGRQEEVLYGNGQTGDMMNRNTAGMANILAQQSMNGGATDMMQRNPQLTPQLMARIQQMRDMARQQQMQANNNAIGARAMRGGIPRFAFGTDNSAQYQQNGMGNSWIPSTNNSYAQGKEIPPALQKLIDMGMPIPPALLNSVTGGQSGPLNMASAFTARGGGSLPSLQGMDRMSQDEREAFGGYLTGPIGMPEASTMDSIGRPTSNLQTAARSRMG